MGTEIHYKLEIIFLDPSKCIMDHPNIKLDGRFHHYKNGKGLILLPLELDLVVRSFNFKVMKMA